MGRAFECLVGALLLGGCATVAPSPTPVDSSPTVTPSATASATPVPSPTPSASSSTPRPSPSPEPSPSPTPLRSLTLNVSGDLLWHNTLWDAATIDGRRTGRAAMDFLPQLASLQSFVSRADLAICHEEVPFAPP